MGYKRNKVWCEHYIHKILKSLKINEVWFNTFLGNYIRTTKLSTMVWNVLSRGGVFTNEILAIINNYYLLFIKISKILHRYLRISHICAQYSVNQNITSDNQQYLPKFAWGTLSNTSSLP